MDGKRKVGLVIIGVILVFSMIGRAKSFQEQVKHWDIDPPVAEVTAPVEPKPYDEKWMQTEKICKDIAGHRQGKVSFIPIKNKMSVCIEIKMAGWNWESMKRYFTYVSKLTFEEIYRKKLPYEVGSVVIIGYVTVTDKYGNESEQTGGRIVLNQESAKQIRDWNNINPKYPEWADEVFFAP